MKNQALKKPNVRVRLNDETGPFTEADIRGLLCNPIYAGVGPYPALVADDLWVRVAMKAVQQEGLEQFLVNMLTTLRVSLSENTDVDGNVRAALKCFSALHLRTREGV